MKLKQLNESFAKGFLSKRLYWQLGRERLLPLLEYQGLLAHNDMCIAVEIHEDGIVLVSRGGSRLYFDFSQTICRAESILLGSENEDWAFLQELLPPTGIFFDIGANVGWFSLNIHQSSPQAELYAFEPIQATFRDMQRNLALNHVEEHVHAFNMGFYSKAGQQSFFVPPANEAASLQPNTDPFYMQQGNIGQAEVRSELKETMCAIDTLDHFVEEHRISQIDFIKCDVEGAEKMVFEGGAHVFIQQQPVVYTEMLRKHAKRFGYHPNDIIRMFQQWGYCCYRVVGGDRLQEFTDMDDETMETNFFFLHQVKHKVLIEKYGVK